MSDLKAKLKAAKPRLIPVTLGDVECFVRSWSDRERIEWALYCQTQQAGGGDGEKDDKYFRSRVVARSLCDENGTLTFTGEGATDEVADLLVDIEPAYEAVLAMLKNTSGDEDEAKKNSTPAPCSDSSTS